jgi:ribosomal protein S18 acetylase RimI-like enzyme
LTFAVRRLGEQDLAAYRQIRSEGLRLEPLNFASTPEEDDAVSDAEWCDRLSRNFTFGVYGKAGLLGTATYYAETGAKTAHRGHLVGVYVRAEARGSGAATMLIEHLLASAKSRLAFLYLIVNQSNGRAIRFYERLGFTKFGHDPGGLVVDGTLYEDCLMMLRLDGKA